MTPEPLTWPGAFGVLQALATGAYVLAQGALVVYTAHRWTQLAARPPLPAPPAGPEAGLPLVTVQLPVYDEPRVVVRLIDAVAALDWPADRLEIQVLDDSDDATVELAAAAVARHRARGCDITHVRRGNRHGFKAGALAAGLATARGEFVAVFDADFVPPPRFLRALLPHFADPRVGMAQARWGHLNRAASALTQAQAAMLDAHFRLEHATRAARGLFLNFNGTAGLWRRRCIESAGGWSHDTLTEDLDLSYRAQLAGWRFVYDDTLEVPAELPSSMAAFKSQQRRWAKGSIQTARKLLPALLRSELPPRLKLESVLHLTANVAYPLLLALSLALPVVLTAAPIWPLPVVWALQALLLLAGLVPVAAFLARGQAGERAGALAVTGRVLAALVLGAGLCVNNTRAVLEGLRGPVGDWERTPKTGERGSRAERPPGVASTQIAAAWLELALSAYFIAALLVAARAGQARVLPFLALLALGLVWVGARSLRSSGAVARRA